jgi:hypothetical protein
VRLIHIIAAGFILIVPAHAETTSQACIDLVGQLARAYGYARTASFEAQTLVATPTWGRRRIARP